MEIGTYIVPSNKIWIMIGIVLSRPSFNGSRTGGARQAIPFCHSLCLRLQMCSDLQTPHVRSSQSKTRPCFRNVNWELSRQFCLEACLACGFIYPYLRTKYTRPRAFVHEAKSFCTRSQEPSFQTPGPNMARRYCHHSFPRRPESTIALGWIFPSDKAISYTIWAWNACRPESFSPTI